jgi:solute carrier family 25 citrate transporter 1
MAAAAYDGVGGKEEEELTNKEEKKTKKVSPLQHLLAGGTAGFVESSICHPLDTIKTRMQLRRQTSMTSRALGSPPSSSSTSTSVIRAGGATAATNAATTSTVGATAGGGGGGFEPTGWKHRMTNPPPPPTNAAAKGAASYTTSAAASASAVASSTAATTTAATTTTVTASLGPFGTARRIVQREGPLALYKGLTAVYTGIVPKMAIRFVSFEYYRDVLGGWHAAYYHPPATNESDADEGGGTGGGGGGGGTAGRHPESVTFLAGLLSGLTEAILVVTPAEVCKIRMQSQYHSMMDPAQRAHAKYKNVMQTAMLVAKEEGFGALYKGVVPTMLRQGCNQAVNFTAYNWSKGRLLEYKRGRAAAGSEVGGGAASGEATLDHWQTLLLGGLSGGMGPLANNPLDVVKTRMQKQVITPGKEPKYNGLLNSCIVIGREEGVRALWRGITPRLMRIMPGQAITFMTYEAVTVRIERYGLFD